MERVAEKITGLIGHTPLLTLNAYSSATGICSQPIVAKLEGFNPLSSVKDRVGQALIEDGEARGVIKEDTVVIEPTSGNTGIGLAMACTAKGYRLILTMPETMSMERRMLLKALGAELVLTEGSKGMKGAIAKAEELRDELSGYIPGQFDNPANPACHERTTGPEILEATGRKLSAFVAGIGTGGTISGTGRALKNALPHVKIIGVEPAGSPVISGGQPGPHKIQGIGAGFIPKNLDKSVIDQMITVTDDEAFETCRLLSKTEGYLVGISSGAALCAATKLGKTDEYKDKKIVVLLPDSGERYLSTGLFDA